MTAQKYTKITVSGQICTGKTTLYKALGAKLGWPTFSTGQFFRDYAAKHQLSIESAAEQNATITKKIDYQVREMLKGEGKMVVEGWMAGVMAESTPGVLRVLLTCQNPVRYRRFADREQTTLVEAKKQVTERDTNWLAEIAKIYGRSDIFAPKHYDLVIDTTKFTPPQILRRVLEKLLWPTPIRPA
jgi:predicted cytidylate kinase